MRSGIEELDEAIDGLDPDLKHPDQVRRLLRARARLDAYVCGAVGRLHESGEVAADGAVSTAQWLRTHAGCASGEAATMVKRATLLAKCAALEEAWGAGQLSSGQVDHVFAKVTDVREPVFLEQAPAIVAVLPGLSVRETEAALRHWASMADAVIDAPPPDPGDRKLFLSPGHDGWGELSGRLDPAGIQVVSAALAAAYTAGTDAGPVSSPAQRWADGLVAICRYFLDHADLAATSRGSRPDVHVVVTLAELEAGAGRNLDGHELDRATVGSLLCDAGVHRFITSGASIVLDAGRTTRTVSHQLFTALALRDGGCRFQGCDLPVARCEAHHVVPWQQGGATDQSNLVMLCWRHHHDFAHHPRWRLKLLRDATIEVTRPDGTVLPASPRRHTTSGSTAEPDQLPAPARPVVAISGHA